MTLTTLNVRAAQAGKSLQASASLSPGDVLGRRAR
jgi:hypothetical protein